MLNIVHMTVNGKDVELAVDPRESLLDTLRNRLGLTSVKKGCEVGECGACTVLVDGEAIDSCIYLTMWAEGRRIMTVEGLKGPNGELSPIQTAFIEEAAVQCGFCTPGLIMSAVEIVGTGKRYNRETLEVKYKGKSIYDVLDMTVEEALEFFKNVPSIHRKIQTLYDVGLSYVKLGQPSTELSGGEAQRIKLATELSKRSTGKTIYILDEPTTGLHFADVHKLIEILRRLSDGGNTVVVIEHNLDVIKTADYIIDMGPEGGDGGGTVIAQGTPEEVAQIPESYTGQYVKKYLGK